MRRAASRAVAAALVFVAALAVVTTAYVAVLAAVRPPRHHSLNTELFRPENFTFKGDVRLGGVIIPRSHGRSRAGDRVVDYDYGDVGERLSSRGDVTDPGSPLVVLGCSIAWGQGVEAPRTFAAIVARALGVRHLNLAVPGTGTLYAALRLEQLPALRPTTIVYALYEDHLFRNLRRCAPVDHPICHQMPVVRPNGSGYAVVLPRYVVENVFGGLFPLIQQWYLEQYDGSGRTSYAKDVFWTALGLYNGIYKAAVASSDAELTARRDVLVGAFAYSMGRIVRYARERGAGVVVAFIPGYSYPNPLVPLADDLRRTLASQGVRVVDMAPRFNRTLAELGPIGGTYPFVIPGDGHPNDLGHALLAEAILGELRR